MKKSLIALAVAGALTAPMVAQADATLYGSFRMGLVGADGADIDLRDESTRIGIKGDVDLGLENTKGLFQWEANVSTTDENGYKGEMFGARLGLMGLTGNWGTALVGRQYHPYYTMVNSHTNIFQTATGDFGEALALGNMWHKRTDNTLAYASPVMGGFQAVAGLVIAGDGSDDNDNFDSSVDGYNVAAQYTGVEGLRVSASYGNVDADRTDARSAVAFINDAGTVSDLTDDFADAKITGGETVGYESEVWGLGATYSIDALTLAAKYEERDDTYNTAASKDDVEWAVWEVAAQYQIGATALKARYGNIDLDEVADGDQWGLEVEHKLGNRGYVWVGYTDFDKEAAVLAKGQTLNSLAKLDKAIDDEAGVTEDLWVIGYRLDF